jgi:hypothetical protein
MQLKLYEDKCLCGSGQLPLDCCLKDSRPQRISARTGRRNRKCYAAAIGDCSKSISREHYITEGVLKLIGDPITLKGFPWQGAGERTVGTKALTAKILCERHNTALSSLDEVGIRFFDKLRLGRFERSPSEAVVGSQISLFRGEMIELWMLKVLCGLIVSGNAPDKSGSPIKIDLPPPWLGILFGYQPMPPGWGLWMRAAVGHVSGGPRPNSISVIYDGGVLNGFIIILGHLGFVLVMNQPPNIKADTLLEDCTYRPAQIEIDSPLQKDILRIFWDRAGDERIVVIAQTPIP